MSEIAVTPIEVEPPTPRPTPITPTPTHATSIPTPTSEISSPTPTISLPSPTPSASSHIPTHPTIYIPSSTATSPANKPVDNYSPRQYVRPAEVTPTCKFFMRGHCQYGKQCQACAFAHPPMCYKFLRNGTSRCAKGSNFNYTHHKMCRVSLSTGNCMRRNCHYYHKSGTNLPIVKTEIKLNPSHCASYSNSNSTDGHKSSNPQPSPDNNSLHKASYSTSGHFSALVILYIPLLPGSSSSPTTICSSYTPTISQSNLHLVICCFFRANECAKAANDRNAPCTKPTDYDYEPGIILRDLTQECRKNI